MGADRYRKEAIFLLFVGLIFGAGCASQVAPTGGSQDTVPPEIVTTSPPPGALQFRETTIILEFSEYVDRRSFQESVFLSPSPGALRYEWGGREVEISFADTLRPNMTYILTVGTDLKDSRNNRLAKAFNLPFSTGGTIDSCSVAGRVHDASPGGIMVFAYAVADGRGDTLNPASVKPDYLTQTGADGFFTLRNMKEGVYRLMAVRDVFKNLLYNVQTDMYGMATADIRLGGERRALDEIGLRLTAEDTLRPFVSGVRTRNRSSLLLRFNEGVNLGVWPSILTITDTSDGRVLAVFDLVQADSSERDFVVNTAPQDTGSVYRLVLGPFTDRHGNESDSSGRAGAVFQAALEPDTLPPVIMMSIDRDSLTGVLPGDTVRIAFNEPVDTTSLAGGFSVLRSDSTPFPGGLRWTGPMMAEFFPDGSFAPGLWYAIAVVLDSVRDRTGNVPRDSLLVRRFRIAEEKQLGSISGDVPRKEEPVARAVAGRIFVEAQGLSGSDARHLRVSTDSSGGFLFDRLPEGLYLLSAFIDENNNGVHDCGIPYPVRFAEPFGVYTDTLKVRPRWPIEGVLIGIGK